MGAQKFCSAIFSLVLAYFRFSRFTKQKFRGNIKDKHEDEIAEWDEEELSNYHTITIPYGPRFNAQKIEILRAILETLVPELGTPRIEDRIDTRGLSTMSRVWFKLGTPMPKPRTL